MIAAIYARKSTDQAGVADDQKSVARQVESARSYAASKGWTIDEASVFVDDGVSGAEFANRPGFLRLMNALKPRPEFSVLIVSELSRLGREQLETGYAVKQLSQAGVAIHSYLESREILLDSPTDKFLMSAVNFASEIERERARQRTYDAMARKARAGHVTGGSCFGYTNVDVLGGDGQRSHVVREVNEREAAIVREIFGLAAKGYGKGRIAKLLNERAAPSPRPKQGRPTAWAPSSVRAVLYRESYRGVTVWNRTRSRDAWGQAKSKARPESEWLTIAAPELRIVTDAAWEAAHARLAKTRATYVRGTNGQLWGRPPAGVASKYLLVGIGRCSHCGAGLEVRSRSHGKRRAYFYSCSSFYRRGKAICPNRYEIPMERADAAVIEALLADVLTPEVLEAVTRRAVELARVEQDSAPDLRDATERQLADCRTALGRLTAAVAAGGDVPALVEAIKAQDGQRQALERRLRALDSPVAKFDPALERRLREAVGEWRAVLGQQVAQARQVVQKLLAEKVTFTPIDRSGRRGFRFQTVGTVEKLIFGSVPGCLQSVVGPTGFEPVLSP